MSSSQIQAKIKAGLAKAVVKTGSATSEKVYRVRTIQSGTPVAPVTTETVVELVNAIFTSYEQGLTDVNIRAGDRRLVSDADNTIQQNDIIRQGSTNYIVISVNQVAPTSDRLAYISQVRAQ